MVLLEVYSKNLKDKYKTTLFSKTTLFAIILTAIKIVVPFLLAYRSKGLWLKRDVFYEQPEIKFRGEYIILAVTTDPSHPILCTTLPEMYSTTKNYDNCSTIKVKEIDSNFDGKMDNYFFKAVISKAKRTEIIFLTVIIMMDYTLHTVCSLHMQSAIIFQQAVNPLLTHLEISGDLRLNQIAPLHCHFRLKNNHYNYSIVSTENKHNMAEILSEYNKRNLSTHLRNIYTSNYFDDQSRFTLKVDVRYPEDTIYYRPGFWQIIKWAWIQYFAVYIVIAWFMRKIEKYIFENRLVLCYINTAIKEKNS